MKDEVCDYVKCPFYKRIDTRYTILCEGLGDAVSTKMVYHNNQDMHKQLSLFCRDKYCNCELYRMLMQTKYEED